MRAASSSTGEGRERGRRRRLRRSPTMYDTLKQQLDWFKRQLFGHKSENYALERRSGLEVFLDDPEVAIDTNHLERALRPIPLGKRNWLFTSSEVGAQRVGIIQSLLVTCRLQAVDSYTYLVDVLQRISVHPAKQAIELTPRMWKSLFADAPLRSDLGPHHHDPPSH